MVSMENKDPPHGAGKVKVDLVLLAWCGKAHMQEIGRVFQFVPWIDERLAKRIFVGHRRKGWHFRDHANSGQLTLRRIVDIDLVVIESPGYPDQTNQDGHR